VTKIRNQKAINAFGKKIKTLRKSKGLSQYNLAFEANIDRSQVIAIENGTGNPTISTIYALAEALKVKPKELLD
jgi:transcriptional regulator with XRE-family HTH domain